jgi:hypothetical protein
MQLQAVPTRVVGPLSYTLLRQQYSVLSKASDSCYVSQRTRLLGETVTLQSHARVSFQSTISPHPLSISLFLCRLGHLVCYVTAA